MNFLEFWFLFGLFDWCFNMVRFAFASPERQKAALHGHPALPGIAMALALAMFLGPIAIAATMNAIVAGRAWPPKGEDE